MKLWVLAVSAAVYRGSNKHKGKLDNGRHTGGRGIKLTGCGNELNMREEKNRGPP